MVKSQIVKPSRTERFPLTPCLLCSVARDRRQAFWPDSMIAVKLKAVNMLSLWNSDRDGRREVMIIGPELARNRVIEAAA